MRSLSLSRVLHGLAHQLGAVVFGCRFREFTEWCPSLNVVQYCGSHEARQIIRSMEMDVSHGAQRGTKWKTHPPFDVLLTTYDILILDSAHLSPYQWAVLVVDEVRYVTPIITRSFALSQHYW